MSKQSGVLALLGLAASSILFAGVMCRGKERLQSAEIIASGVHSLALWSGKSGACDLVAINDDLSVITLRQGRSDTQTVAQLSPGVRMLDISLADGTMLLSEASSVGLYKLGGGVALPIVLQPKFAIREGGARGDCIVLLNELGEVECYRTGDTDSPVWKRELDANYLGLVLRENSLLIVTAKGVSLIDARTGLLVDALKYPIWRSYSYSGSELVLAGPKATAIVQCSSDSLRLTIELPFTADTVERLDQTRFLLHHNTSLFLSDTRDGSQRLIAEDVAQLAKCVTPARVIYLDNNGNLRQMSVK